MPDLGDGPSFLGEERPGPAKMRAMRLLLLLWLLSAPLEAQWWKVETSGIDTNLRSVSVARASNAKGASPWVVWASGSNGVILESADEGETGSACTWLAETRWTFAALWPSTPPPPTSCPAAKANGR